ncbi:Bax inhibitor-1/YccA family protein [Mariniblastus fucicola]|uniref:HflBKC-binding inner membrane protein n=1 Tax=Mariniblastus fucicola TaxID=980251 RepID=A0A5B9PDJ7_9BACT|nr:Bax inhibitor-1 family protein [Mariniblastus fucicola]QEG23549.1 HflBKC-binding inner membrane protein [Mariniblastus fucicola]
MSQNPYQSPQNAAWTTADLASVDERSKFIRNTYLHVAGAFLAFAAIDAIALTLFGPQIEKFVGAVTQGWMWLVFLGGFMAVSFIADKWAHSRTSRSMQYVGLGLYVVAEAILFLPLLFVASRFADPTVIPSAGILTLVVFGGLSAVVFLTKADFSFLRYALWIAGFAAMGLIVASFFMPISLGFWFSAAMIIYAAGSILYSTSNILHHYNTNQHVAASLALFSSVALMLWYVIQLFMSFDE